MKLTSSHRTYTTFNPATSMTMENKVQTRKAIINWFSSFFFDHYISDRVIGNLSLVMLFSDYPYQYRSI